MTDLLVDIGNTRLKWRLQQQGAVQRSGAILVRDLNMAQLQAILPESAGAIYWAVSRIRAWDISLAPGII